MTRDEILSRYRTLRAIAIQHHSAAMKHLPKSSLFEGARQLGLAKGRTIFVESDEEESLILDLAVHTAQPGRSRAIDRYRRAARLAPGTEEARMLEAMCGARFAVLRVEHRHETAGLVVFDVLRKSEIWLVDESMEWSLGTGEVFTARICQPDDFTISLGAFVLVDEEILDDAFFELLPEAPDEVDAFVNDPRLARLLFGWALASGSMERVRYARGA